MLFNVIFCTHSTAILWLSSCEPFQCWGYSCPKYKDTKVFDNHQNPVMLVFIGKLSLSTLRWVPICQGFDHFSGFLHLFVLTKLVASSIRVNGGLNRSTRGQLPPNHNSPVTFSHDSNYFSFQAEPFDSSERQHSFSCNDLQWRHSIPASKCAGRQGILYHCMPDWHPGLWA